MQLAKAHEKARLQKVLEEKGLEPPQVQAELRIAELEQKVTNLNIQLTELSNDFYAYQKQMTAVLRKMTKNNRALSQDLMELEGRTVSKKVK